MLHQASVRAIPSIHGRAGCGAGSRGGWAASSEAVEAEGQRPGTVWPLRWAAFLRPARASSCFPGSTLQQRCSPEDGPTPPTRCWHLCDEKKRSRPSFQGAEWLRPSKDGSWWRQRQCPHPRGDAVQGEIFLERGLPLSPCVRIQSSAGRKERCWKWRR